MGFSCSLRPDSITDDTIRWPAGHPQSGTGRIPGATKVGARIDFGRLFSRAHPAYAGRHDSPPSSPRQAHRAGGGRAATGTTLAARLDRRQCPVPPCGGVRRRCGPEQRPAWAPWPAARRRRGRGSGALPRAVVAPALAVEPRPYLAAGPRRFLFGRPGWRDHPLHRRRLPPLAAGGPGRRGAGRAAAGRPRPAPARQLPGGVLPRLHARHGGDRRLGHVPPGAPPVALGARAPLRDRAAAARRADPVRGAHADRAGDARRPRASDLAAEPARRRASSSDPTRRRKRSPAPPR